MIDKLPLDIIYQIAKILNTRHPLILLNREISQTVDVTLPPKNPDSLIYCVETQKPIHEIEELLKDPRIDPSIENDSAIIMALRANRSDVVSLLIADERANLNEPPGFKLALALSTPELLTAVVECPRFDIKGQNNTALVHAARRNWPSVVRKILLRPDSDVNHYSPFSAALCAARNKIGYQKFEETIDVFMQDPRLRLNLSHLRMSSALDEILFHKILTDTRFVAPVDGERLGIELQKIACSSRWTTSSVRRFLILYGSIEPKVELFENTFQDTSLCQEILTFGRWTSRCDALNHLIKICLINENYPLVGVYVSWALKSAYCHPSEICGESYLQPCIEYVRNLLNYPTALTILDQMMLNALRQENSSFVAQCLTLSDWKSYNHFTAAEMFDILFFERDIMNEGNIIDFEPDEFGSYTFCSLLFRCFVINCGQRKNIDYRVLIDLMVEKSKDECIWDPSGNSICYLLAQHHKTLEQEELLLFLIQHPVLGISSSTTAFRTLKVEEFNDTLYEYDQKSLNFLESCENCNLTLVRQHLQDKKFVWFRTVIMNGFGIAAKSGFLKIVLEMLMRCTLFQDNGGIFEPQFITDLVEKTRSIGHTKTANTIEKFAIYDQRVFYYLPSF